LEKNWGMFRSDPGQFLCPSDIDFDTQPMMPATVPCTVASTFNLKEPDCWTPSINYDDFDWWYSCEFESDDMDPKKRLILEGLATLAQVWLNDELLLDSQNMFHCHSIDVETILSETIRNNIAKIKLTICFRSLNQQLSNKRPRPKWKTKLVANQSLRWYRTTLLGRIPSWMPPVSPVGPWKPIYLADKKNPSNIELLTSVEDDAGCINLNFEVENTDNLTEAFLVVDQKQYPITLTGSDGSCKLSIEVQIENANLWWPHTHGTPHLYQAMIVLIFGEKEISTTLPSIGFSTIDLNRSEDNFEISINNQSIFCRGACWTVSDIISLRGGTDSLTRTLTLMRNAGANMIRVGGTMLYEQDEFYQICSELGIMIWQDFMFANMDYPFEDGDFTQSVEREIDEQITRFNAYACLTIFCGNSEIQQQVAMQGFKSSMWDIPFFETLLADKCKELSPQIPYVSSSPSGGELPFRTNQGLSHYYGVGAYSRPVSELRSHDVKFTSECLGFSNIPIARTRNSVLNGQLPVTHNPIWKQRTPRDTGTGWDFEDVRDHYLKECFSLDPVHLRSFEPERYMQLSEIVTGEIMSQVYSEWRSSHSDCNGGLVWFMKDLWPGAGWGIIDSYGKPKACYYFLKRIWQPINLYFTNENINGLDLHICNDKDTRLEGEIEVVLYDKEHKINQTTRFPIEVLSHQICTVGIEDALGHFCDPSFNYRFGSNPFHAITARLVETDEHKTSTNRVSPKATYFPKLNLLKENDVDISIELLSEVDGSTSKQSIKINSDKFLYAVNIEVEGFHLSDNYFHLEPEKPRTIEFLSNGTEITVLKGAVTAINLFQKLTFRQKITP